MGVSGGIILLWSYLVFIREGAGGLEVFLFILGTLILTALAVKLALWCIPRNKLGIYLSGDQEGYVSSSYDRAAIGKEGEVLTDLKPGGFILVEGKQMSAISLTGYLEKGKRVIVVSGEGEALLVKLKG